MEMPKTWKFIKQAIEEDMTGNEEVVPCIYTAMDLLKEFAEATEEMVTACKQGYARDTVRMERALKKFKEWK